MILEYHELPYEAALDRFGIKVAGQVYSRKQLEAEIHELLSRKHMPDANRLRFMLTQEGEQIPKNLKETVQSFARPFREEVIDFWEERLKMQEKVNGRCLAELVSDWDQILPPPKRLRR